VELLFVILTKAKGWYIVQKDPDGLGNIIPDQAKSGWVPAGKSTRYTHIHQIRADWSTQVAYSRYRHLYQQSHQVSAIHYHLIPDYRPYYPLQSCQVHIRV